MKAIASYVLIALLLVASVSAMAFVPDTDVECAEFGYDWGIARWDYTSEGYVKSAETLGYTTSVVGDDQEANWTTSTTAATVIIATANETHANGMGSSGTVVADGIDHLTFCGKAATALGGGNSLSILPPTGAGVPEFSVLTLGAAVALSLLGVLYLRKQ